MMKGCTALKICTSSSDLPIHIWYSSALQTNFLLLSSKVTPGCLQGGDKDVLVATDVASKGLDFPNIQHVINYDLPNEIENYVHRIGRTGRSGKTGIATTFINKNQSESILLDLKHLLREAKQRIPPILLVGFLFHNSSRLSQLLACCS